MAMIVCSLGINGQYRISFLYDKHFATYAKCNAGYNDIQEIAKLQFLFGPVRPVQI